MSGKILRGSVILVVLLAFMLLPARPAAAAPVVVDATATPNMISLFGDDTSARGSPFGPMRTWLVVRTTGATSVKADLKSLLLAILPADAPSRVLSGQVTAWNTWTTSLENTALTDLGGGYWTRTFSLEDDFFSFLPPYFASGVFRIMAMQELRLGAKSITVTASDGVTPVTGTISLTIVDAQIPLIGNSWNVISTPFALTNSTWADVRALGNKSAIVDAALRYDASAGAWALVATTYAIQPLEAVYLHATQNDSLGAIISRTATAPPSRSLYAGWNLVGPAPDFLGNFDTYSAAAAAPTIKYRGASKANEALISVFNTSGTGYTQALSAQSGTFTFTSTYSYTGIGPLGTYTWAIAQPPTAYVRGNTVTGSGDITSNATGWMVPFYGYWVFMDAADTLAGYTSTPVPDSWITKLLTLA